MKKIISASPLNEVIEYSTSLEKQAAQLKPQTNPENTLSESEASQPNKEQKLKTITFEKIDPSKNSGTNNSNSTSYSFIKEKIEEYALQQSELSKLLGERKQSVPVQVRKSEITVVVFMPPNKQRLKVRVEKTATVEEVMKAALQQYPSESLAPQLYLTMDNCYLMMAEDDGTPDKEIPQLNPKYLISRFGNTFCLQPNQSIFVVHLPNQTKVTLKFQPSFKLSEVLHTVCSKRGMPPSDYYFKMGSSNNPVKLETTLQELGVGEIMLTKKC